jgi:hypothetical protein
MRVGGGRIRGAADCRHPDCGDADRRHAGRLAIGGFLACLRARRCRGGLSNASRGSPRRCAGSRRWAVPEDAGGGACARRRGALQVDSFAGYAATLARFANAFGDKHVRSRPVLEVAKPDWAGLIVSRRGTHWIVADAEQGSPAGTLLNAQLISCDGRTPDDWGGQILGHYRVDWSVDAQRIQAAPWLLISERNPFVPRPNSCVFAQTGLANRRVALDWRHVSRSILAARMDKVSLFGAAGFGVRKVGTGYWIAVQELTDNAVPVAAAVQAQAAELREAPFVVLDLRGNGGGSSMFGDEIAAAILGDSYVKAVVGDSLPTCGGEVIRVSDDNLRQLQMYRDVLGPKRGPEFLKTFGDLLNRAEAARAAGRGFTGPLSCPRKAKPPRPCALLSGQVIPADRRRMLQLVPGRRFQLARSRGDPARPDHRCRHPLHRGARRPDALGPVHILDDDGCRHGLPGARRTLRAERDLRRRHPRHARARSLGAGDRGAGVGHPKGHSPVRARNGAGELHCLVGSSQQAPPGR